MYQAYLTAIASIVVVVAASSAVGDNPLTDAQTADVLRHGPPWLGVLASALVAVGLRSGSFGGPLAIERAEVRHVLLAPVDRATALRTPAIRRLRFLLFGGVVTGAIAGQLAHHRIEGATLAWVATGALAGGVLVLLAAGAAFTASGLRLRPWMATVLGLLLVGSSLANALDVLAWGPGEPFGELVLWPLKWSALGIVPIVVGVGLTILGLVRVGHVSLEAQERRSHLVGQLRFAATLQDLRTVVVLRRQLAMELPRVRPWIRLRTRAGGRAPVLVRGIQGLLRWPAARLGRLVLLGAIAGLALRGVWAGTTPLIIVAGLAMFLASLDTVESLAQEVDHPSRRDASPLDPAVIHLRHVPVGVLSQMLVALIAAAVAAGFGDGALPTSVAAVTLVPQALGAVAGAIVSVLSGPMGGNETWALAPPEAQGMRVVFRSAWPPALAVLGTLPILAARAAVDSGDPTAAALRAATAVAAVFALVCGWVRLRDEISTWTNQQMEPPGDR
ncbi:MAG: hypothetical protein ACJ739_08845 [Acidimicrobiales bacterium]